MKRPLAIIAFIVAVVMVIGLVALTWDFTGSSQDATDNYLRVFIYPATLPGNDSGQYFERVSFDPNNDGIYEQVNTSETYNASYGLLPSYMVNFALPDNVSKVIHFKVEVFNVTNGTQIQMSLGSDGVCLANTTVASYEQYAFNINDWEHLPPNTCAIVVLYDVYQIGAPRT